MATGLVDARGHTRIPSKRKSTIFPIYDKGHSRNGCWPCLMDIRFPDNKLKALRQSHPKMWRFLILDKGVGIRIIALKRALCGDGPINPSGGLRNHVEKLVDHQPQYFEEINV